MTFPESVIDTHCHVIASDTRRYPLQPMGGKQSDWSRDHPVDAQGMLEEMAAAGVKQSVLVQASTCYGHDSSYVRDSVKAYPERFVGVCSVNLLADDAAVQASRWRAEGLSGIRFFVAGHSMADHSVRLDDLRARPAWQYASENGVPVCVQIRADGLPQVKAVLQDFPDVTIFLDHFARPVLLDGAPFYEADALWSLAHFKSLNFKLTTHNLLESEQGSSTPQAFCKKAVDVFGAHRIAWGSNFPASGNTLKHQLLLALNATAELTEEDRKWIFWDTARRIYPSLSTITNGQATQ